MFGGNDSHHSLYLHSTNALRNQRDTHAGHNNSDELRRSARLQSSFLSDISRDSGCVFSNLSFSSNQSVDTSLSNQTFESGFACESFDSFNCFPSINNVSYDGCYFEDESPRKMSTPNKSVDVANPGILATAVAQGGDLGQFVEKLECEALKAVTVTTYAVRLRQCWETIAQMSELITDLTMKPFELEEPKEWNLLNFFQTFQQQYNKIREQLRSPRMTVHLLPIGQILDQIRDTPQIDHGRMFEHLQDYIQLLHWILAAEVASRKSIKSISKDQFRIDKAYEFWNKCS